MILLFQISGFSWFMDLLFVLVSVSVDSLSLPWSGSWITVFEPWNNNQD